jgi:hypothetical protein
MLYSLMLYLLVSRRLLEVGGVHRLMFIVRSPAAHSQKVVSFASHVCLLSLTMTFCVVKLFTFTFSDQTDLLLMR